MTTEDLVSALIRANSIMGANDKLVASLGTRIISDTSAHTDLEANSMIAQTDSVIASCTGINEFTKTPVDFVAAYNWVNISAGIPIIAPTGCKIKSITLTSGSIAIYS